MGEKTVKVHIGVAEFRLEASKVDDLKSTYHCGEVINIKDDEGNSIVIHPECYKKYALLIGAHE